MKNPFRHVRFSLTGLFAATLFVACVVATLRYATRLWADATFTLALAVAALAALGSVYRTGTARAFWVGALLGGGGYLFLAYGPWIGESVRPHLVTTPLLLAAQERMHAMFNRSVAVTYSTAAVVVPSAPPTVNTTPADATASVPQPVDVNPYGAATTVDPSSPYATSTPQPGSYAGTVDLTVYPYASLPFGASTYSTATVFTADQPDWDNLERAGHSLTALLAAFVFGVTARRFYCTPHRRQRY